MEPIISVIVPVYNAEKFLRECINSILLQTFTEIECLLVDDGSKDSSGVICDEYALKDSRVKVIHQENGGEMAARAAGIRLSKGKYLYFVDADDQIMPDTLSCMLSYAGDDVDIVAFESNCDGTYSMADYAKLLLSFRLLAVWGKLYKRSLFDDYVMGISRYFKVGEDFLMNIRTLGNIEEKVVCKPIFKYLYNTRNPESVQLKHRSSFEYERALVLEVGDALTRLPEYSAIEYAHFKWLIIYLGGMIGLRYRIDFTEDWVEDIRQKGSKYPLSLKERLVLSSINWRVCRWLLVEEKQLKAVARRILKNK